MRNRSYHYPAESEVQEVLMTRFKLINNVGPKKLGSGMELVATCSMSQLCAGTADSAVIYPCPIPLQREPSRYHPQLARKAAKTLPHFRTPKLLLQASSTARIPRVSARSLWQGSFFQEAAPPGQCSSLSLVYLFLILGSVFSHRTLPPTLIRAYDRFMSSICQRLP